jgi:hypothetical protein
VFISLPAGHRHILVRPEGTPLYLIVETLRNRTTRIPGMDPEKPYPVFKVKRNSEKIGTHPLTVAKEFYFRRSENLTET